MRTRLLALALLPLAACDDGTAPPPPPSEAIHVAFVEVGKPALQIVEEGLTPSTTPVQNALPFAALENGIVVARQGGLSLYYLDGSSITVPAFIGFGAAGGATSPDGSRLAYSHQGANGDVFLHTIQLASGQHDSLVVSGRQDAPAASQILGRRPVWSPSGDTIAFLLPNFLGLQLFLYEVPTGRIEMYAVPVPVTTYARPLDGWPYWDSAEGGSVHFVAWRHENDVPTDTLVVMRVFPGNRNRQAEVVFAAHTDTLPLDGGQWYSFSSDGRTVALAVQSGGRSGIFTMHRGVPVLTPVVFDPSRAPIQPLLIP